MVQMRNYNNNYHNIECIKCVFLICTCYLCQNKKFLSLFLNTCSLLAIYFLIKLQSCHVSKELMKGKSDKISYQLPCQQICFEISIEHEFHHSINRFISGADPQKFDDVFVVEPFHHISLRQEIQLFFHRRTCLQSFHGHCHL